jgi:3-deoxy-7-phosphoheptulonate synthase
MPRAQQPAWPEARALHEVLAWLSRAEPLVSPRACDVLRSRLGAVARGEAFLLQGGDCAETFNDVTPATVGATVRTLDQMATLLEYAGGLPVVRIGRMAGQYAKPRTNQTEIFRDAEVPAYRGDAVNGLAADDRVPDARRLRRAYEASATTLEIIRDRAPGEFFTSHEGLLLDYEDALTRIDPGTGRRYATSGHLLWIGERTRDVGGGHVGYFATIRNPVAVKIGPTAQPSDLLELIDRLDPERTPGRLTFISRMGAGVVQDVLPGLVSTVVESGAQVAWVCDPMHGNTFTSSDGYKTRAYDDVVNEVRGFFDVHASLGTHAGGLHLELTGEDVTECVGEGVGLSDLGRRYRSACDPRLSRSQSLDLAFAVAGLIHCEEPAAV